MKKVLLSCLAATALCVSAATPQAEKLDRGVVAVKTDAGVFVSWRSLVTDAGDTSFDIYRDGTKINTTPITTKTNFIDETGSANAMYEVRATSGGNVFDKGTCAAWAEPYKKIHINRPAQGSVDGHSYTYTPDDLSIGDVDGDGVMELFVKWMPSDAKDSASSGFTGPTIIDCYKIDGTQLWRVDLGHNIRSGNHYTQFMVYDFDGDGCAEMICKTAPGTKDGKGNWVLMGNDKETDDYRIYNVGDRKSAARGHVLGGSEYLTCFSGKTGEALSTIAYKPGYNHVSEDIWGDNYCNRSDRYLGGVAYLDGLHPSVIMCRGYYRCAFVWAVDFKDGKLQEVWFHESKEKGKGIWGQGAHSLTVGDVDADGKDEIIYGAGALDHDGTVLYSVGGSAEGHGDALHLAKMIPDREGLQVFMPHENKTDFPYDTELRDARTGQILFSKPQSGNDIGRGLAANVSPNYPGYEYWAASDANVYSQGVAISTNRPSINFRIYWDGDLLDECLDGTWVTKPAPDFSKINTIAAFEQYSNAAACNGTKNTPNLQADLFGDWREEVILHDGQTQSDLLIFTTTEPTVYKIPTLLQDHQYRMAIAWQNTAYNQPPHTSFSAEDLYDTKASILLSSGASSQMVTLGSPIENVVLKGRNCTSLSCGELPAGIDWNFDAASNTGTISGTPTAEGDYIITVTTGGSKDGDEATMQIKLKVNRVVMLTPLAYYSFDNPGATVTNHVKGEAVAKGTAPIAVDGKKGKAALLDGTNYYTQDAYDEIQLGNRDFTIEFWMKSKDDAAYIFHKGSHSANASTGATGHWIGMELKNDVLYFAIDDDATKSQAYVKEAGKWFNDEWHHVVGVRDTYAKKLYLYVDGVQVAEGADATAAIADNKETLVLGNVNVNFDNMFAGALDEFTIYEGAMEPEKVSERYATTGAQLAYFPFDVVGETTPNLVYGEATAVGAAPEAAAGKKDGAVNFTGSYYSQPAYDAIQFGEKDFTVELWFKSTDNDGYLFFKGSHSANAANGTTGHWVGIERHSNGSMGFIIDDDVNKKEVRVSDANAYFDGQWHHFAGVRNFAEKTLEIYLDGELKNTTTGVSTGAIADNNEPLLIGCSDETARPYEGMIDELIIHPKALTADEIKQSYTNLSSSITEVIATRDDATYTIVDAMSGIMVRRAKGGDASTITNGISAGIYVLVIEIPGEKMETYKFIKD
ncbi:MAG: LamG domain-containing protein [Muribaculaceae bacterium]|nr:LamG domain-containing protein [Muribaculaceae bacterium]